MSMTDLRAPAAPLDYAPVTIVASCDSCEFDGEVKAAIVDEERGWSESAVVYEFGCPAGHLNRMRVEDGDDS